MYSIVLQYLTMVPVPLHQMACVVAWMVKDGAWASCVGVVEPLFIFFCLMQCCSCTCKCPWVISHDYFNFQPCVLCVQVSCIQASCRTRRTWSWCQCQCTGWHAWWLAWWWRMGLGHLGPALNREPHSLLMLQSVIVLDWDFQTYVSCAQVSCVQASCRTCRTWSWCQCQCTRWHPWWLAWRMGLGHLGSAYVSVESLSLLMLQCCKSVIVLDWDFQIYVSCVQVSCIQLSCSTWRWCQCHCTRWHAWWLEWWRMGLGHLASVLLNHFSLLMLREAERMSLMNWCHLFLAVIDIETKLEFWWRATFFWFQRFDLMFTVPQKLMVPVPAHIHIMAMVAHINIQEVPWSQISVCAGGWCHWCQMSPFLAVVLHVGFKDLT